MTQPLVTAIVSTYNAERFMRSCLEDLVAQTLFDQMEVLVIDSGSSQNENVICQELARTYPQITLLRTEREPLYAAWNRAIPLARGKYLTSVNTDDRHHPRFIQTMAEALERHPHVALAYADQFISHTENESFAQCEQRGTKMRRWPDYTQLDLLWRCITGSQPAWRASLHAELGVFNTRYRIAADYDMWLRFASQHPLVHVAEIPGVFYYSPTTISGANNQIHLNLETLAIQQTYVRHATWRDIPGARKRLAAEIFGRGYRHIERDHGMCPAMSRQTK